MKRIAQRTVGTVQVLRGIPGERRVPWLPHERIGQDRDRRVRGIVRYAAAHVPYYRDTFREAGLDPDDVTGAADLARLPLLEKAMVRQDPERFRATSREGLRAVPFVTSGTTGTPLTIYHDIPSIVRNPARCEPEKAVEQEILGRRRGVRRLTIIYGGSTIRQIWEVYRRHTFLPVPSEQSLLSVDQPLEAIFAHINRRRPDVISGYGSFLEALFRYAAERDVRFHRPLLVSYGADAVSEPGKQLIRDHFGIPLVSRYGAVESFRIGFTCPEGHGFHIRDDLCHLRIVDSDGHPLPPGRTGEVVISNLVNRGSVLLNYRLGDIAALSPAPCPCGRSLPLLTGLEGRLEDVLYLPNGQLVHPRSVWACMKNQSGLLRYQLRQLEPDRFELLLVLTRADEFNRLVEQISPALRRLLGNATIAFRRVENIATPPGGKFRPVVALRRQPEVTA